MSFKVVKSIFQNNEKFPSYDALNDYSPIMLFQA